MAAQLDDNPWFHGDISREEAEQRLWATGKTRQEPLAQALVVLTSMTYPHRPGAGVFPCAHIAVLDSEAVPVRVVRWKVFPHHCASEPRRTLLLANAQQRVRQSSGPHLLVQRDA